MGIFDLIDKFLLGPVTSIVAKSALTNAWATINEKSWEDLYLDAFSTAFKDMRPQLPVEAGLLDDVKLSRDDLRETFKRDLLVDLSTASLNDFSDEEFAQRLAEAIAAADSSERPVLILGGHQLTQPELTQLALELVRHARANFEHTVRSKEAAFREEVVKEAQGDREVLRAIEDILQNQFGVVVSKLDQLLEGQDRLFDALNTRQAPRQRACPTAPPPPAHFAGRVEQLADLRQRLSRIGVQPS